jgi:hypothetical protein
LQQIPKPALARRAASFIPCVRIPDLVTRLSQIARPGLSTLDRTKVFQQAAEERLTALEIADAELHRLYSELKRRETLIRDACPS